MGSATRVAKEPAAVNRNTVYHTDERNIPGGNAALVLKCNVLQPDVIGAVQVKNKVVNIAAVRGILPDNAVCISISRLNGDRICG